MRVMWKGSVGFGMVNIPVKLYKATDSSSGVSLCNIHRSCGTPVKEPKYCPTCDKMLDASELQKAYPEDSKKTSCIPLEPAEMEALPLASSHTIQIDGCIKSVPDIRYYKDFYVLEPEDAGIRAYRLLEVVLKETGQIAVAKIGMGSKEHLCGIMASGDGLLYIVTLNWTSDIRDLSELKRPSGEIQEKELMLAKMLIESLPQDIDLSSYTNTYGEALKALVAAKKSGEALPTPQALPQPEVDLIDQLMASLQKEETDLWKMKAEAGQ